MNNKQYSSLSLLITHYSLLILEGYFFWIFCTNTPARCNLSRRSIVMIMKAICSACRPARLIFRFSVPMLTASPKRGGVEMARWLSFLGDLSTGEFVTLMSVAMMVVFSVFVAMM